MEGNSKGMAIAALVCGILGIIGGFIPGVSYFTLVLAIVGIVLGVIARKKGGEGKGMATAGMVCGIVGVSLTVLAIICVACTAAAIGGAANDIMNSANDIMNSANDMINSTVISLFL